MKAASILLLAVFSILFIPGISAVQCGDKVCDNVEKMLGRGGYQYIPSTDLFARVLTFGTGEATIEAYLKDTPDDKRTFTMDIGETMDVLGYTLMYVSKRTTTSEARMHVLIDCDEDCESECTLNSDCDDGDECTTDWCVQNPEITGLLIPRICENRPITYCKSRDGCCPPGCNVSDDSDCSEIPPPTELIVEESEGVDEGPEEEMHTRMAEEICTPGVKRCSGDIVQKCSGGGTAWNDVQKCPYGCYDGECNAPLEPQQTDIITIVLAGLVIAVLVIFIFMKKFS
jgi:hypothetical protein